MNKKLIISLSVLFLIIGIYFLNSSSQNTYLSTSKKLMNIQETNIKKIVIQSGQDAIEIIKEDTIWTIAGNDTLKINEQTINRFFDITSKIEIQNMMTTKKEKWSKYNVDDSLGVHLALIDWDDQTINYYVFGRSKTDFARCYVRVNQKNEVYLLNENIIYNLQSNPTFWGEPLIQNDEFNL